MATMWQNNATAGVSAGCRQGVGRVSQIQGNCVCSLFALIFATFATPMRPPCDGGDVATILQ